MARRAARPGLVGTWCNPRAEGPGCWSYDRFSRAGHFLSCGQAEGDPLPFIGRGRYTLREGRMCYRVTEASANFWLPAGARYCTQIEAIDAGSHRYRDLDSGQRFTLTRVPAGALRCPPGAPPAR